MFEGIDNMQYFADTVKGHILDMTEVPKKRRMDGLRAISELEKCGWHPAMMRDAVVAVVGETDNGWAFLDGEDVQVLENIERVIRKYLLIHGGDTSAGILSEIFDVKEAAEYLGISVDAMKSHAYRWGNIQGAVKGRTTLFTKAQLDALKREHIRG